MRPNKIHQIPQKYQQPAADFVAPTMITAREARGLTQSQLADGIGISQGKLSKIEQGLVQPEKELIQKISSSLNYPVSFFSEEIDMLPVNHMFHRKRKSIGKKVLNNIDSNLAIARLHIGKLLSSITVQDDLPRLSVEDYGAPDEIARKLRLYWKMPAGPVKNLTGFLESKGALIFDIDVSDKLDGMTVPNQKDLPLIYLNHRMPVDRRRFTLSHELGHIVMHTGYIPKVDDDVEKEADQFAAEFLLPARDMKAMCKGKYMTIDEVGYLKRYWRVSMAAILVRLNHLDLITPQRYRSLYVELSRLGYRKHEPDCGIPEEKTRLLAAIVDQYITRLNYSEAEVADLLKLKIGEFKQLYRDRTLKVGYRRSD